MVLGTVGFNERARSDTSSRKPRDEGRYVERDKLMERTGEAAFLPPR